MRSDFVVGSEHDYPLVTIDLMARRQRSAEWAPNASRNPAAAPGRRAAPAQIRNEVVSEREDLACSSL